MESNSTTPIIDDSFQSNITNITEPLQEVICYEGDKTLIEARIFMNVFLGVVLSIISIITNSFNFIVFVTNKQHINSPNFYMMLLAVFDVFMGISFLLVLSIKTIWNWNDSLPLKTFWMEYAIPMLTLSHIVMTSSTFLICFAATERCCLTLKDDNNNTHRTYNGVPGMKKLTRYRVFNYLKPTLSRVFNHLNKILGDLLKLLQRNRMLFAILAVIFGLIGKGTMVFEIHFIHQTECIGQLMEYKLMPTMWPTDDFAVNIQWRIIYRNIFTILLPFVTLIFLLCIILISLFIASRHAKKDGIDQVKISARRARIRATTNTLIVIMITYLLSNSLSAFISIMEFRYGIEYLLENYMNMYILSVDILSILSTLASCTRLPIYLIFQPILRKEMIQFATQCYKGKKISRRMTLLESPTQPVAVLLKPEIDADHPSDSSSVSKIVFV